MEKIAFVVAGTHSGCGKTTVASALMAAFKARGHAVQPFKIGPDFIDPGFHTQITGVVSRNLDGWMLSRAYNRSLFRERLSQAEVSIVEGVMGLYDGYDGTSEAGSSAQMAKWLDIPVVLVVDARSMARSAAALVYGFTRFDPNLRIAGVVFNRVAGPGHFAYLRDAMLANLPDVAILGGIPREEKVSLPERHLGLVIAEETLQDESWRVNLAHLAETYLDLDVLAEKASYRSASNSVDEPFVGFDRIEEPMVQIAVARDRAFCFYYSDNFDWLERAGAQPIFFSPLNGDTLPASAAGLYLGGGYPELHAEKLAHHHRFLEDIRDAMRRGMPIYAECGGLMVLSRFIKTSDGVKFPMAGVLPFGTKMLNRRKALGYTEVVVRSPCLLGNPGLSIRGHEFHYSDIVDQDSTDHLDLAYELQARKSKAARHEGYSRSSVLASYIHLHFGSQPEAAWNWVERCRAYQRRLVGAG